MTEIKYLLDTNFLIGLLMSKALPDLIAVVLVKYDCDSEVEGH
jgi:hypothetical protein